MTGGQFRRPPVKSQKQLDQQAWFRAVNRLWSYLPASEIDLYQRATTGTPWMPRDWFVKLTARVAWAVQEDTNDILWPTGWIEKISNMLDLAGKQERGFLARTTDQWQQLPVGAINSTLTSAGPLLSPTWIPNPFVSDLTPPALTTFPNQAGPALATLAQEPGGPLDMAMTPPYDDVNYSAFVRELADPPQKYIAKIRWQCPSTTREYMAGLIIHGDNDEFRMFSTSPWETTGLERIRVSYYRAGGAIFATTFFGQIARAEEMWMRIDDDGVNFTYFLSAAGAGWVKVTSEPRNNRIGDPTTIGIALNRQRNTGNSIHQMTVLHWSIE